MWETQVQSLSQEDPLEKEMTTHSSILAEIPWKSLENPMEGGAWEAAVHGVTKSRTWLSDFTFLSKLYYITIILPILCTFLFFLKSVIIFFFCFAFYIFIINSLSSLLVKLYNFFFLLGHLSVLDFALTDIFFWKVICLLHSVYVLLLARPVSECHPWSFITLWIFFASALFSGFQDFIFLLVKPFILLK